MGKKNVDDYLQEGIYGPKEIKKEEKKLYLGTFRERVILALTPAQVRKEKIWPEVLTAIKQYPKSTFLLNGQMEYEAFKKYIQLVNKHQIPYRIVTDKEAKSEFGLVITVDYAVDIEGIFISEEKETTKKVKKKKSWFSF